jgi:hypothetical protein
MRTNLVTLMKQQTICHPSSIVCIRTEAGGHVSIKIRGFPWWREGLHHNSDGEIEFVFEGVSDGILDLAGLNLEDDKALEDFEIVETEECAWLEEYGFEIYCSAPIPNPLNVYTLVHDYLVTNKSNLSALDFLNTGSRYYLSEFRKIVASNSFLLCRAPAELCDLVIDELNRQGVQHNKLPSQLRDYSPLLVTLGGSQFFCKSASAIFDD